MYKDKNDPLQNIVKFKPLTFIIILQQTHLMENCQIVPRRNFILCGHIMKYQSTKVLIATDVFAI